MPLAMKNSSGLEDKKMAKWPISSSFNMLSWTVLCQLCFFCPLIGSLYCTIHYDSIYPNYHVWKFDKQQHRSSQNQLNQSQNLTASLSTNSTTNHHCSLSPLFSLALFCYCRQLGAAETSNLLLGDRARPEQACGVGCAVRRGVGGLWDRPLHQRYSQALLGCTQSQPNKKPFIGGEQLSQMGWEHVAFKNEEGGRGGGRNREKEAREWGEWQSKNEEYDSARKANNKESKVTKRHRDRDFDR